MSESTPSRTIPVGILVSVTGSSRKRARCICKPQSRPRCRIPWCHVLAAVSAVWLLMIVGLAVLAVSWQPVPVVAQPTLFPVQNVAAAAVDTPAPVVVAVAPDEPVFVLPDVTQPAPPPLIERAFAAAPMPTTPVPEAMPEAPAIALANKPAACAAKLGTSINFIANPPEAFQLAKKENKIVFMIHLSGNFEDKEFT